MISIFEVLALPARRDIIERLREGPRSVGELTDQLGVSQPVMSKHLRILRDAGFVTARVDGQHRRYELRPEPFVEIAEWLEPYRLMWEQRLDLLGRHLDTMREEEAKQ
jgi:DNA-binding transcriptional ArsR family regulator